MKHIGKKLVMLGLLAVLMAAVCSTGYAKENETNYAVFGDGNGPSTFFVQSFGNARVILTQQAGRCGTASGSYGAQETEEWGKYHVNITSPTGRATVEEWNQNYSGSIFQLNLQEVGVYMVEVVPYTTWEMKQLSGNSAFNGWMVQPRWWLFGRVNCNVQHVLTTDVCVLKREAATNQLLAIENRTVEFGTNEVDAGLAPDGYVLMYPVMPAQVEVYQNGMTSKSEVVFYYQRGIPATATPAPTPEIVNPYVTKVTPVSWETRFRPETCTTSNQNGYTKLNRLYDGKASTVFDFVLWNSEWKDGVPQFTAFFGGSSVSAIGIVNGKVASEQDYEENASVRILRAVVHSASGSHEFRFTVPDQYTNRYQPLSFGKTIKDVYSVELYVEGTHAGTKNKYVICISDVCFYQ